MDSGHSRYDDGAVACQSQAAFRVRRALMTTSKPRDLGGKGAHGDEGEEFRETREFKETFLNGD